EGQMVAVRVALSGYLAPLESQWVAKGTDYPLFPAGQLMGGRTDPMKAVCRPEHATAEPVTRDAIGRWFLDAEQLAGVPHVEGRRW
ncbi:hypothetical protein ACSTLM_00270, partial [Vibrio parahaemolyticus]